jgi:hypothetical protein
LEALGWSVIRLWETDIKKDPDSAAATIMAVVASRRTGGSRSVGVRGDANDTALHRPLRRSGRLPSRPA